MKVLKIYLKNCPAGSETQIYCIKHDNNEDLMTLKSKLSLRCPQLRSISCDPQIYWYDLENDKIKINCDDDLRFFLEESEIRKITFEFATQESRKRRSFVIDDDNSECSKKLRKDLQNIDLSSQSSMDTDETDENEKLEQTVVTSTNELDEPIASTSFESAAPKINVVSVEVIENDKINENINNNDNITVDNEVKSVNIETEDVENNGNNTTISEFQKQQSREVERYDSSRIVISDSSSDDDDDHNDGNYRQRENASQNRNYNNYNQQHRHSYGGGSFSFSFSGTHRPSFHDDINQHVRNEMGRIQNIRQNAQNMRQNAQNMRQNAQNMRQNAQNMRQNANMRQYANTRQHANNTRQFHSQILSNFQEHFSPLFGTGNFGNFHR